MPPPDLEVLIIGGGIGGLTAGISCKEKGFQVRILESQLSYTHVSAIIRRGPHQPTRPLICTGRRRVDAIPERDSSALCHGLEERLKQRSNVLEKNNFYEMGRWNHFRREDLP